MSAIVKESEDILADRIEIKAASAPTCLVCGHKGEVLYSEQEDRLFGAVGSWNIKRCSNRRCNLLWLDPMPLKDEVWKAYLNYYTHSPQKGAEQSGFLRRAYRALKFSYWSDKYGYHAIARTWKTRALAKALYLFPFRRERADMEIRFLEAVEGGRLLDVGCGSGDWLLLMRELGWDVEGMDFDEAAVKVARGRGLRVGCGALEQQHYPSESFDVVTMNHVIEHVPDPLATLVECRRILKPSGKLVLFTPNSSSMGHRIFGNLWRGLEPPRHLHIMSPTSIEALLSKAGFSKSRVLTYNSKYVWEQSCALWQQGGQTRAFSRIWLLARLLPGVLTVFEQIILKLNCQIGECIGATCRRS